MIVTYSTEHTNRTEMTAAAEAVEQENIRVKTKEVIISSQWSDMETTKNYPHTK